MTGRAAQAAAAAFAAITALAAVRTWRAERQYEAGICTIDPRTGREAIDRVSTDLPGRLEAYRRAVDLDPDEPLYALRAGEIVLSRAVAAPRGPGRAGFVRESAELLERSRRLQPLDARVHHALATLALESGDVSAGETHARAAVLLGPRSRMSLEGGCARLAWVWQQTGSPRSLAAIVEAAARGYELADGRDREVLGNLVPPAVARARAALTGPSAPLEHELLSALAQRPDLLRVAARLLDEERPGMAAALRTAADRAP